MDVGTANIHVAVKDGGVVVREPALVAFAAGKDAPVAFGIEARQMLEQGVANLRVVQPIRGGCVADFGAASMMLRHYLQKALGRRLLFGPLVLTAHSTQSTPVARRALVQALRAAGAGRVIAVQKSLAAAIGAGLAIDAPDTQMVIDIGAGGTDAAAISMGMITEGVSIPIGGQRFDETLLRGIKRRQDIRLTPAAAEEIKLHVGAIDRSLAGQLPAGSASTGSFIHKADDVKAFGVQLEDVPEMLYHQALLLADELAWTVEEMPAKVRAQVATTGAAVTGGGAQLRGLPELLSARTGVPCTMAVDPMACTMLGLQAIVNNLHALSLDGRRMTLANR